MKEYLKSETSVQPVNRRMLIKVITDNFPTMTLLSGSKPSVQLHSKMYIAGTSVEEFNIGDEVLVDINELGNPDNKVKIEENENSYSNVKDFIKSLKNSEYNKYVKDNPKTTLIEYVIVYANSIIAVINSKSSIRI